MKPVYSFKSWIRFLKNDAKTYLENLKGEKIMRTTEDIEKYKPEEFEIDEKQPKDLETATFALGCFWSPDAVFGGLEGVVRTRVGYAGGEKDNPTYRALGNHTETIQIDYDADKISYEELLEVFWENHDPSSRRKTQYASKIFYSSKEEKEKAEKSLADKEMNGQITTEIQELDTFWIAEDYHQKYYLRQNKPLINKIEEYYSPLQIINSTVTARLNAVVSGKMRKEYQNLELPVELEDLTKS